MKHFDPNWTDIVADISVLEHYLMIPKETPKSPNSSVWIKWEVVNREECFEEIVELPKSRLIAIVARRSNAGNKYKIESRNLKGEMIESSDDIYDLIFPPRAWMTTSLQELCSSYAAAKLAEGKVLVGGLGLAIYPQLVWSLNRPVSHIVIVENNPDVIAVMRNVIMYMEKINSVSIVQDTIENYMQNTTEKFDTIYLDTWGDLHFRFIPYINYLISLAEKLMTPVGKIQCWGYNFMYTNFVGTVEQIEANPDIWDTLDLENNTLMRVYIEWRKKQTTSPTLDQIRQSAIEIAQTIDPKPIELSIDMPMSRHLRPPLL